MPKMPRKVAEYLFQAQYYVLAHTTIVDDRWAESLDQKIELIINRDGVDAKEFGGKDYDE